MGKAKGQHGPGKCKARLLFLCASRNFPNTKPVQELQDILNSEEGPKVQKPLGGTLL